MALGPNANAEQPTQVDDLPESSTGVEEPAASHGFSIYGEMAGLVSFQSWIGDSREDAGYGFFAAGYWGPDPLFHLGAFFHYYQAHGYVENPNLSRYGGYVPSNNAPHLSTGVSLKIGGRLSDRIWIGGVIDLGAHMADSKLGVHFFPRLEVDSQLTRSGRFKLGLFASFGLMLAPGLGDFVDHYGGGGKASLFSLQAIAGLMFGA